jgi:muconolactone D-isomerase
MEFLLEIEVNLPSSMSDDERTRLIGLERERGRELAEQGVIRAIWRVPGKFANRAIWSAADATELHDAIVSLPLWSYSDVNVTPLARHAISEHCLGLAPGLDAT